MDPSGTSDPSSRGEGTLSGLGAAGSASVGVGAALAAGVAGACCVGPVAAPLTVAVLGAGGAAWAAGLKPYSPLILTASGLLLAYALWSLHGRARESCAREGSGASRWKGRLLLGVVWGATVLWVVSLGLNLFFVAG